MNTFERILSWKPLPYLLFTALFAFSYAPYFLYVRVPIVEADAHFYMFMVWDMLRGLLPFDGYPFSFPVGLSAIIAAVLSLGGDIHDVILLQTVLFLIGCLMLIRALQGHGQAVALPSAILLWLFASLSEVMRWNTAIQTESLYMSSIMILAAGIITHVRLGGRSGLTQVAVGVILASLVRSNGAYALFVPGVFAVRALWADRSLGGFAIWSSVIVAATVVSALAMGLTWGDYIPFQGERAAAKLFGYKGKTVLTPLKPVEERIECKAGGPNTKASAGMKLLSNMTYHKFGNYYYYRLQGVVERAGREDAVYWVRWWQYRGGCVTANFMDPYARFDAEEYADFLMSHLPLPEGEERQAVLTLLDIDRRPRHPWLYANHLVHLTKPLTRNVLFMSLFYAAVVLAAFRVARPRSHTAAPAWETVLMLAAVHLLSVLLLTVIAVGDRSLYRYAMASETMVPIVIVLGAVTLWREYRPSGHESSP
jgi:hypothetical protein